MTLFRLLSRKWLYRLHRPFSTTAVALEAVAAKQPSYLCGPAERPLTDLTIGQVVDRADRETNIGDDLSTFINVRKLQG